jgi:uncharacterized membrane protein
MSASLRRPHLEKLTMSSLTTILIWASAIGTGMMAGVYFAFSSFIMSALGRIPPSSAALLHKSREGFIL